MITCLIILIIILNYSLLISLLSKKKIDNGFAVSILFIIALLYLFGLFGYLKYGIYAVYTLSIIAFILNLIIVFYKKEFDRKIVFTKGFFAFIVVFIIFGFIHKGRLLSVWDEFSHWGDVVKAIYDINDFQTNPLSMSTFKSYPPAMSMFQYFWMNVNGSFNESYLYMAFNVFGFSCMLPLIQKVQHKRYYIISLITIFVLPMVFFNIYYQSILIDPMVAIVFAYGIYLSINLNDKYDLMFLFLVIFCLVLLKDVGLFFAIVIAVVLFLQLLREIIKKKKKFNKFVLLSLVVVILSIIIAKVSWSLMLKINDVKAAFGQKISINDIFNVVLHSFNDYRISVINNFHNALYTNNIIEQFIPLDFIKISLIYIAVFLYMIRKKTIDKEKSVIFIGSLFVYCFALLLLYCFRFSEYEAVNLASYSRYLSIVFFGLLIVIFIYTIQHEEKIVILFLIIMFVIPYYNLFNIGDVERAKNIRLPYDLSVNYIKTKVKENDKIYVISQNTNGYDFWVLRYSLRPVAINPSFSWSIGEKYDEKDIWTLNITDDQWMNNLIDNNYDYVFIYKCDMQFINQFNKLFNDVSLIKNGGLYKVDASKRLLTYVR